MEKKRIEDAKTAPELQLFRNIQLVSAFENLYKRCIKNFNRIVVSATSIFQKNN